jgi:hypothetical protein
VQDDICTALIGDFIRLVQVLVLDLGSGKESEWSRISSSLYVINS